MNQRVRLSPEETRQRIVTVAEEHFRRVGYAKTTVADIAQALGMSPANVYRFFDSKSGINNAICKRFMAECETAMRLAADGPGTPSERLRNLALTLHHFNKTAFTDAHRLHDMVAAAMEENWPAIEQHLEVVRSVFEGLIQAGIEQGEFHDCNPAETARTLKSCYITVFHPALIAQCADDDLEALTHRITDLVLRALRSPAR